MFNADQFGSGHVADVLEIQVPEGIIQYSVEGRTDPGGCYYECVPWESCQINNWENQEEQAL